MSPQQNPTNTRRPRPPVPLPVYCRFADLHAAGIIQNWTHLQRLIAEENFPCGVLLSRNVRAWTVDSIQNFLDSRPTAPKRITRPYKRDRRLAEATQATSNT